MRSRLDQLAREKQFCGSLALVQNGEVVARSSFGNANPALSIPNTPETQFNIGSIGKMFTAIAIAKLVEDKKLKYDRPIRESLSELSNCPDYHAALFSTLDFTPHELLTHTAGLNDSIGKIYENFLGADMLSFNRVEDYFSHFAPMKDQLLQKRGTHHYSNLGYFLLGLAIEAIEGDYYNYVKESVFIPADMKSTVPTRAPGDNFALPTATSAPSLPNTAPQWLVDISQDQRDTKLSRDAHFALMMLADIRKITEKRDQFVAEILAEYQKISTLSPAEYPQFRAQLIEKIKVLHEIQKGAETLKELIIPVCKRLHKQWENNPNTAHDFHLQQKMKLDKFLMETLVRNAECPQLNCFLNSLSIAHPAGCWYSTVDDLIKFDQSFQNGKLSTYRSTLMENAVPDGKVDGSYGYGCAIAGPVSDPLYHLGHTGGMPGGLTNYQHYPNTGYTLVMLSNEGNYDHIFGFADEIESAMRLSMDTAPKAVLDNAKIPALSAAWVQHNETHSLVGGVADSSNSKPADAFTLFQAASLSKVVSAAIILDLVAGGKWDLDTPLAEMGVPFGSVDMKADPRYETLTTRMIIAQCSGLPNWFQSGSDETFITEPGVHFTYSGVAYECLKEVIEKNLGKTWGELAQDFFAKVGMKHSTFQLPENTHLKDSTIAQGHAGNGMPAPPPSPDGFQEVPAASLLTTAEDYVRFLQHCYADRSLQNLFSSHTTLNPTTHPETPEAHQKITWGLGMGIFKEGDREIAFHWGNNPNSHAFCAMNIKTGDAVACFINSENGPNVFQTLSENIVGDIQPVFEWLSQYCHFNATVKVESPEDLQEFFSEKTGNRKLERDQVCANVSVLDSSAARNTQVVARDTLSASSLLTSRCSFLGGLQNNNRTPIDEQATDKAGIKPH